MKLMKHLGNLTVQHQNTKPALIFILNIDLYLYLNR